MGCRNSVDIKELIEIKHSIDKQNEYIQTLVHSRNNELKEINDKIANIEIKISNIIIQNQQNRENNQNGNKVNNQKKYKIKLKELSNELEDIKYVLNNQQQHSFHRNKNEEINNNIHNNKISQKSAISQRKFPKPRTVKLHSLNSNIKDESAQIRNESQSDSNLISKLELKKQEFASQISSYSQSSSQRSSINNNKINKNISDVQLNAIHMKMDYMRNMIRNEISKANSK